MRLWAEKLFENTFRTFRNTFINTAAPGGPGAAGGGLDGTERIGTRSDGCKQGRNSADGCGEDRARVYPSENTEHPPTSSAANGPQAAD